VHAPAEEPVRSESPAPIESPAASLDPGNSEDPGVRPDRPTAPEPEKRDFAAFQEAAIASANQAAEPESAPREAAAPEAPHEAPASPTSIEEFDTPRPDEMTTTVPDETGDEPAAVAVSAPPPPPPPPVDGPMAPSDVVRALAARAETSPGTRAVADSEISTYEDAEGETPEVDPALIARLIQGVKDL
jgi:hypothetical protein